MKRILLSLLAGLAFAAAHAITLFPHFVDVSGEFEDGTPGKFVELNISTDHWRCAPSWYKDIKSADNFLMDTLPFSSYVIDKDEKTLPDGTKIITYVSSLEADGLNEGKWSTLFLVQSPDEPLYVGISEDNI